MVSEKVEGGVALGSLQQTRLNEISYLMDVFYVVVLHQQLN